MTLRFRLPLISILLMPAAAFAQPVQDFQLPPAPTPSATPDVQGPVNTDGVVPVRPRVIPTASPTPTPEPVAEPPITLPRPLPTPTQAVGAAPAPTRTARPAGTRQPNAQASPTPEPEAPPPLRADDGLPDSIPDIAVPPAVVPAELPPLATDEEPASWSAWLGIIAALGLAAAGGAFAVMRRRKGAAVPTIERPTVGGLAAPASGNALNLRVEALKLSRSVMNATLFYRVTVLNRSQAPLSRVAIEADLTSAHGDAPMEQQLSGPQTALQPRHEAQRLAAGQSARFEGQIVLPLAQAKLLRQGQVALLVPLLRMRATAAGAEPIAKTFAIGPASSGGGDRLVPFRLDEGPRSYEPLAQKAIS